MKKAFYSFFSDSGVVFEAFDDGSAVFSLQRAAFDDPKKVYNDKEGAKKIIFEYKSDHFRGMSDIDCDDLINKFYSFVNKYPIEKFPETQNEEDNYYDKYSNFIDNNFDDEQDCKDYLGDCFYDIAQAIECAEGTDLKAIFYIPKVFYSNEMCELVESCIDKLEKTFEYSWEKKLGPARHTKWALENVDKYNEWLVILNDILDAKRAINRHYSSFDYVAQAMTSSGKYKVSTIDPSLIKKGTGAIALPAKSEEKPFNLNELVEKNFEGLVGLEEIKLQLKEILAYVIQNNGKDDDLSLHMAFVGSAGTGKTTVAQIVANVLAEAKVLKSSEIVSKNATSLQAEYLGQTQSKVEKIIKDGVGKVTLIDEAYALAQGRGGANEYKQEAVSTLITGIEEHRKDACFIFAGYTKEMEAFFNMNPGLKSRIPSIIEFRDFSEQEINKIFDNIVKTSGKTIDNQSLEYAHARLATLCKNTNFANARGVRNTFMRIKRKQALRVNGNPNDNTILFEDVKLGIDAFEEAMRKTDQNMIGFGGDAQDTTLERRM